MYWYSLNEIYDWNIIGPEEVLNHEIHVDKIEYYEQSPLAKDNPNNEFYTRPELNRKHLKVMCSKDAKKLMSH